MTKLCVCGHEEEEHENVLGSCMFDNGGKEELCWCRNYKIEKRKGVMRWLRALFFPKKGR